MATNPKRLIESAPLPERLEVGGVVFCRVPDGEFIMGKNGSNAEVSDDQKPQHTLDF